MTIELLEQRLEALTVEVPDAGRITARVLGPRPPSHARRWPRVALSVVAALVLMALVAYFAPSASTVVARVPLAGDALGARDRVTFVGDSATSNGYTITLVAAYADATRTVLNLHISPAAWLLVELSMTDQFGRTYTPNGSVTNYQAGESTVEFGQLGWPDSLTGARITIDISQIEAGIEDTDLQPIKGSWTLHANVGVDEGTSLALPAPATLGRARLTFTSIVYTPESIAIDLDVAGVSMDDLQIWLPDEQNPKGSPVFSLDVVDAGGNSIVGSTSENQDWFFPVHVHLLGNRSGAGRYEIIASYHGERMTRTIVIP